MDVSIIIINYNTFDLTCNCIQSIYDKVRDLSYEIILVDNASTETPAHEFLKRFPNLILVDSPENVGFSRGNNLGLSFAQGKFALLLNSDTELKNNAVLLCKMFLDKNQDVAACGSKLLFPNGVVQHNCQRFPSIKYKLFELLRLQKFLPKAVGGRVLLGSFFDHDSVAYPDWIWGTFFMFRKRLLEELPEKKLDDSFFMYGEDMEWCRQFRNRGYRTAFVPAAEIVHHMGMSKGPKTQSMEKNLEIFLSRNYSSIQRRIIRFLDRALTVG